MKAIVYHQYGSPEVLKLVDVEKPVPKDDEVLVRVFAASVNSWDWDLLTGTPRLYRLMFGILRPKLKILGADIAGKVEVIGKNVKQFRPGDEVFGDISGCTWGGFAEYVCATENTLALKSPTMTFEQAAATPQAAVLALQGIRDKGQLQSGQKILINGAGGGVGTFAVQLAKAIGAEITVVDVAAKHDMLVSLGADYVVDYTREDFIRSGKHYDLILDVVAHRSIFEYKRILTKRGRYVMVGGLVPRILQTAIVGPFISMMSERKMGLLVHRPSKQDLAVMNEYFESGKVVPVIDTQYPLHKTADALRAIGEGSVKGKVVIVISER